MPLLELWASNPEAVGQFNIEQVVATAGDGILKDNSVCSREVRDFFKRVTTERITSYVHHCLASSFARSGMVLQDLVNELGRRLDYEVAPGRYQGVANAIGYDGIWTSPDGHSIIAEVKTTDAYRISLDTIASYRRQLIENGLIGERSSILIVVGRQDTGELEAQVRGSRHAWDVRLISAESLLQLVRLKQNAEGPETGTKIRNLLIPAEYTKLDNLVDVMFTAATDVSEAAVEVAPVDELPHESAGPGETSRFQFTDPLTLQAKRDEIVDAVGRAFGVRNVTKRTRALYADESVGFRFACTISKRYEGKSNPYWYAYHPQWDDYLVSAKTGLLVLGCVDLGTAFAIPRAVMANILDALNVTVKPDGGRYWHIHLTEQRGRYDLILPRQPTNLDLRRYEIKL